MGEKLTYQEVHTTTEGEALMNDYRRDEGCWVLNVRRITDDGFAAPVSYFTLHMTGDLNYVNIERTIAENRDQFAPGAYIVTCGEIYSYVFRVIEQVTTTTQIEVIS